MKRHITKFGSLGLVLLVGLVVYVYAGDLNPPAGPVAPTMRTLDEIYNAVAGGAAPQCPPCVWKTLMSHGSGSQWYEAVPGSGVVHAVVVGGGYITLGNGPFYAPQEFFFVGVASGLPFGSYIVDVRYEQGLQVKSSADATILYLPDP